MKYSLPKKIIYSIIVAVLLVGLVLTAFFGLNGKGYGSTYDIDLGLDLAGGVSITYQIKEDNFTSQDVEDTIYKLQKRVEGKSTESQVYKEGDNRITVEIPGVTDANEILKELGTPGSLEFLDSTGYTAFSQGNDYTPLLTGSDVKAAQAYTDTNSQEDTPYGVQLTFTDEGSTKFYDATSANIGKRIYIVYDGEVVSAPNVKTAISGGTATITGMESFDEADNLATYIRVGSIPLTLEEVSSNIVGAQLGHAAIKSSLIAAAIGLALLCLFMIVMFRIPGLVATLSLIIYTALVLFLVSVYDLTLTLPGIAGIILGIGMAVDGNVIIYTRIREEIGAGKSVENAILSGYNKATSSIVDGNVTTLIAALVLYIFGTGPVKGFATTLAVGNIVSIFTSLVITKVIMKLLYNFGIRDAKWYGKNVYRKPDRDQPYSGSAHLRSGHVPDVLPVHGYFHRRRRLGHRYVCDRLDQRRPVWRDRSQCSGRLPRGHRRGRLAVRPDHGRHRRRCRRGPGLRSPDAGPVLPAVHPGGHRLYVPCGLHHGPYLPQVRPVRQELHPRAGRHRLRRAGRYGKPYHRERA